MPKLKSEKHHWWPISVSSRWRAQDGYVSCIPFDGADFRTIPRRLGAIRGGHHIKLSEDGSGETPWDESFEHVFARADDWFPSIIDWLEGLRQEDRCDAGIGSRFVTQSWDEERFRRLVECAVSLAIRSPRTREVAVSVAEAIRGPLPARERDLLIAANIRHAHRTAVESLKCRGKVVALFSPYREFIFGDGFYHSLVSMPVAPATAEILVPLTPRLSLLYCLPRACRPEPKLATLVISKDEAEWMNGAVQIYSARYLFFRSERPTITGAFLAGAHKRFASSNNPISDLFRHVPGVQPGLGIIGFEQERKIWWDQARRRD